MITNYLYSTYHLCFTSYTQQLRRVSKCLQGNCCRSNHKGHNLPSTFNKVSYTLRKSFHQLMTHKLKQICDSYIVCMLFDSVHGGLEGCLLTSVLSCNTCVLINILSSATDVIAGQHTVNQSDRFQEFVTLYIMTQKGVAYIKQFSSSATARLLCYLS